MRTPLLSQSDLSKSRCISSLLLLTFTSVSLIILLRQNTFFTHEVTKIEFDVGVNVEFPPVTNQKIQTCVDLKDTCMGLWISRQGSEWTPVIITNSPPRRKRERREGSQGAASSSTAMRGDVVSSSSGSRGSSTAGSISFQSPPRAPIF